eukprot:Sspe_Gene.87621::Locus_59185_Transcript_1_2_Confidence_0.500_Length_399::g.87621::m.87621
MSCGMQRWEKRGTGDRGGVFHRIGWTHQDVVYGEEVAAMSNAKYVIYRKAGEKNDDDEQRRCSVHSAASRLPPPRDPVVLKVYRPLDTEPEVEDEKGTPLVSCCARRSSLGADRSKE